MHKDVNVNEGYDLQTMDQELNVEDIGVWIDPIGKTNMKGWGREINQTV